MNDRKVKWLIYTVLVGLIPIIARAFVYGVSKSPQFPLFNSPDFVAFGLILHISNINEIEHIDELDRNWKTIQNGVSVLFIASYGVLFALSVLANQNPGLLNAETLRGSVMVLCGVSFLLSYSIYQRVSCNLKSGA